MLKRISLLALTLVLLALALLGCGGGDSGTDPDFVAPYSNVDAPVALAFQSQPLRTAGTTFVNLQVAILNHKGQVATQATNPVTIALGANPGGATLSGTTTRNAVAGIATFNDLSLDRVGAGYTFVASSPGLEGATSNVFVITPAGAGQVTFLVGPSNSDAGQVIAPPVQVETRDAFGNLTNTIVTLTFGNNPGAATLGGSVRLSTVNGVATFADLTVSAGGTGYTLVATADTGPMAISNAFDVQGLNRVLLVPGGVQAAWVTDVQTKLAGTGAFDVVDVFDATAATPTLVDLAGYDAVLTFTDGGDYADPAGVGDVLADFYDAGGRVVTAVFANASIPIQGRFNTGGYLVLDPTGQTDPNDALGNVLEPTSPLMDGVAALAATSSYSSTGGPINGGIVVAEWGNGRPLVVRGVIGGRNRVDLNFYPPSIDVRADFWSGNGTELMRNALLYQ